AISDHDFDFDFDFDFEAGELRMDVQGLEGLEELTLDLTELELLFEGLDGELDFRLEGLDEEWQSQLEAELRRLEEKLSGIRVEVKGR
ncbi:MAG: hypothetical protein R3253_07625, partial [Longimicrobiales bacterium]|nr:hypothetical protein [Longimicrobiales bacterium]